MGNSERLMEGARKLFSLEEGNLYLASCGRTPLPDKSRDAGVAELNCKQVNPELVTHFGKAEAVRGKWAALLNGHEDNVAITPSTSYAVALASRFCPDLATKTAVVAQDAIDSIVLPFQGRVKEFKLVEANDRYGANFLDALRAVEPASAIALLTPVFWTKGWSMSNLDEILSFCAQRRLFVVMDLTQSAGVLPYDVSTFPPNLDYFICCSVHKHLMGVHGTSLCYLSDSLLAMNAVEPVERHSKQLGNATGTWDEHGGGLTAQGYPAPHVAKACRFDAGMSNPVGLAVLNASLELILSWNRQEQCAYLQSLSDAARQGLRKAGYRVEGDSPHIFNFAHQEGFEATRKVHQMLAENNVYTDLRHDGIRVGLGVWNGADEIEKFLVLASKALEVC